MNDKVLGIMGKEKEDLPSKKGKYITNVYNKLIKEGNKGFVGYVMNIGFLDGTIITNDYYKIINGGVPQNSFLLLVNEGITDKELLTEINYEIPPHIILVRVIEPASTPVSSDTSKTYFELHKAQMPTLDIFTKSDLQWSAMKVSVLGTFFDNLEDGSIDYGGDLQSFWSPHHYKVYIPEPKVLEQLVNAFVVKSPSRIGQVRLTETLLSKDAKDVVVNISADDFIGARTALFGKTRMGKSNTVKKMISAIMDVTNNVSMVIFDLNGEYANTNEQDDKSIYDLYKDRCERFTLRDNAPKDFHVLKANFFEDLKFGHEIIKNMHAQLSGGGGDYIKAFLDWEVLEADDLEDLKKNDRSAYTRYMRCVSIYKCLLHEVKFKSSKGVNVKLELKKGLRDIADQAIDDYDASDEYVDVSMGAAVYSAVWDHYIENKTDKMYKSSSGKSYFDETTTSIMTLLTNKKDNGASVSGKRILIPFRAYHDPRAGGAIEGVLDAIDKSKCAILDLSNAPEELYRFFSDYLSKQIFNSQMRKFTTNSLGTKYVQFFFEEAHNLFPSNDKDLKNIYNRLAKEGAKLNIGIAYSTQSISSLSPDLLKNTENFFIAHLNDDREIKELTRFHEFRDVGYDVQRTKTRGFVRMITRSHKFAIPVQIDKF
ncbi:MAG: DUF87 domain-containing protein [Bacteriovoracaceae bacterium]|jgi:hypothetical protein|nr:DUF87 domain-containing protein [Bacteriovoracaceae bacterium]